MVQDADTPSKRSVPTLREVGVREQFDRFVKMSEKAGLPVQPQRASVRVAPPANRTRFLMYAGPRASASGGELGIWVGPGAFAEWFPHIDEDTAVAALGEYDDGAYLARHGAQQHDLMRSSAS